MLSSRTRSRARALPLVCLALACNKPPPTVTPAAPAEQPAPSPAQPETSDAPAPDEPDAATPAQRPSYSSYETLVQDILTAAKAQDLDALGGLMEDEFYFEGPMSDCPMTRTAALHRWRANPAYLALLVTLLEGSCGPGERSWECPAELLEREEYGNAERVALHERDGAWTWDVFIAELDEDEPSCE